MEFAHNISTELHQDNGAGSASQYAFETSIPDDVSMSALMDLMGNNSTSSLAPNQLILPMDGGLLIERSGTPADEAIFKSYENMSFFCVSTPLAYQAIHPLSSCRPIIHDRC